MTSVAPIFPAALDPKEAIQQSEPIDQCVHGAALGPGLRPQLHECGAPHNAGESTPGSLSSGVGSPAPLSSGAAAAGRCQWFGCPDDAVRGNPPRFCDVHHEVYLDIVADRRAQIDREAVDGEWAA